MPQLQAAKKALRQNARRRLVNDRWRKRVREAIHEVKKAVTTGDTTAVQTAAVAAQTTLDKAAQRHILHPNTAGRKKAHIARLLKPAK